MGDLADRLERIGPRAGTIHWFEAIVSLAHPRGHYIETEPGLVIIHLNVALWRRLLVFPARRDRWRIYNLLFPEVAVGVILEVRADG